MSRWFVDAMLKLDTIFWMPKLLGTDHLLCIPERLLLRVVVVGQRVVWRVLFGRVDRGRETQSSHLILWSRYHDYSILMWKD